MRRNFFGEEYYSPEDDAASNDRFDDVVFVDVMEDEGKAMAECSDEDGEVVFYFEDFDNVDTLAKHCRDLFGPEVTVEIL